MFLVWIRSEAVPSCEQWAIWVHLPLIQPPSVSKYLESLGFLVCHLNLIHYRLFQFYLLDIEKFKIFYFVYCTSSSCP